MAVFNDLAELEKKATAALKRAEDQKKDIFATNKDVAEAQKTLSAFFKDLIDRLGLYGKYVEEAEANFDSVIAYNKECLRQLPAIRKDYTDSYKYLEEMAKEKDNREKARKKSGEKKLSKEDQIFEAAFARAEKSMEQAEKLLEVSHFVDHIDEFLKNIKDTYEFNTAALKKAMTEFETSFAKLADITIDVKYKFNSAPADVVEFAKKVAKLAKEIEP
jgi:hypothetical protein